MSPIHRPFALCAVALALAAAPALSSDLSVTASRGVESTRFDFALDGAGSGGAFLLLLDVDFLWDGPRVTSKVWPLMVGPLDALGGAQMSMTGRNSVLEDVPFLVGNFRALSVSGGLVQTSNTARVFLGGAPAETLSFNFAPGGAELQTGQIIDDEFAALGITVSGDSADPGGTDTVAIFDSANPTGGDDDLMTPGPGPGNDEPLGNLLILTDDVDDPDMDGLIDNPGDDDGGGVIRFDFADPLTLTGIKVVDVDDVGGAEVTFFDRGGEIGDIFIPNLGDNAVQELDFLFEGVTRMELELASSGGIATLSYLGCPSRVDFDRSITGIPLGLPEGTLLTEQLSARGVHFGARSFATGTELEPMLFDSEDPTGGDFDLMTPGPHPTNDTPLGLVLVVPENRDDLDDDGLVDVPDDEQAGGEIELSFDFPVQFQAAGVLDVDADEVSFMEFFNASDELLATVPLAALGDNSFQRVEGEIDDVSRIVLTLGGSGALTDVEYCPQFLVDATPGT